MDAGTGSEGVVLMARTLSSHRETSRVGRTGPPPHVVPQSACLVAALICAGTGAFAQEARTTVSLNGTWQMQLIPSLDDAPADQWQPFEVPGTMSGIDGKRAWLRKTFAIPETMRGKRVELYFGGVKYNSRILVNGQQVGGEFNGYDPFTVDITGAARVGEENELLLGCCDWTGIFSGPFDLTNTTASWDELRGAPRDLILGPIGGVYNEFGPWDDVELRARPHVRVERVAITTSVRDRRITAEYALANDTDADASADLAVAVLDTGASALELRAGKVSVPAHGTASVTLEQTWPDPHLWSYEDPHLYVLRTELRIGGEAADRLDVRFGFREFRTQGPDLYLNGSKVHCLASSCWPMHQLRDREAVREWWLAVKAANVNAFRTHTQPWRRMFYEVADEVGILVIPEGAVWNDDDAYRIDDPVFWRNYATHLSRMNEQYRNSPSVVMYSLENEMYGGRQNERNRFATEQLAGLGHMMKGLDPTRPITYESDGDPLGVADVIGIHYPHEYPDYHQYPNTCWWLDQPLLGGFYTNTDDSRWTWKRDKPLYIGEFLWVPSADPSCDTVFYGDEAYNDYQRYHLLAKAESWRMQVQAYRDQGVSGICPWTMIEGGPLDDTNPLYVQQGLAMRPIAAFPREYNTRFFSGDTVTRTLTIHNDALSSSDLTLRWTLTQGDSLLDSGEEQVPLGPGDQAERVVRFRVPEVIKRTPLTLTISLLTGSDVRFEQQYPCSARPRLPIRVPTDPPVYVYDPSSSLRDLLEGARTLTSLADLPEPPSVVVIGVDAFPKPEDNTPSVGPEAGGLGDLSRFVERGGRLIVLRQPGYAGLLGEAAPTDHSSTMAFAQMPGHPALKGIGTGDLKWWAGGVGAAADHLVSRDECARPESGAFRAIVTSGGASGLAQAPLLELPRGKGTALVCQLLVAEKADVEPTARTLLQNMLDYAATFEADTRTTAVVAGGDAAVAALTRAGLRPTDLRNGGGTLDSYGLVVCDGKAPDPAALRAAAAAGATVLLHSPEGADFEAIAGSDAGPWTIRPASGPVTKVGTDPFADHITREDLYWLAPHAGSPWAATPLSTAAIDRALVPTTAGRQPSVVPASDMQLSGQLVQRQADGSIGMFTIGAASCEVDFGQGGSYILGARLGGTPAQGGWPICKVAVDDQTVGYLGTTHGEFDDYALLADVPAGRHQVSLSFDNDGGGPGEDRNMFMSALLTVPADEGDTKLRIVTRPAALGVLPVGRGLVVVDCVRWDSPAGNEVSAARYLCGLLTALGAELELRDMSVVEAETLAIEPNVAYAAATGGALNFGSAGAADGDLRVTRAGEYDISLVARGTSAAGEYPLVEVSLDGSVVGIASAASESYAPRPVGRASLAEGVHKLRLRFTNDFYQPPEDRNVWIDKVVFSWG